MSEHDPKTILVAPLDWGLGHAARMLPIVRFLSEKYRVIVAAPKSIQHIFDDCNAEIHNFPGYHIRYYRLPVWLSLLIQAPKIIFFALATIYKTRHLTKKHKPKLIIADNRPFVRSKKVKSVYITHQLSLRHENKIVRRLLNSIHRFLINRFHACWIPDTKDSFFSGELSKGAIKIKKEFIGGLSRFRPINNTTQTQYKTACVLSGPEPKRSQWANRLKKQLNTQKDTIIIGALAGKDKFEKEEALTLSSHLNDELFSSILINSENIITRSGYTSIMDLFYLKKNAFLEPTPGQKEQEYLAQYHDGKQFHVYSKNVNKKHAFNKIPPSIEQKFCSKRYILKLTEEIIQ